MSRYRNPRDYEYVGALTCKHYRLKEKYRFAFSKEDEKKT